MYKNVISTWTLSGLDFDACSRMLHRDWTSKARLAERPADMGLAALGRPSRGSGAEPAKTARADGDGPWSLVKAAAGSLAMVAALCAAAVFLASFDWYASGVLPFFDRHLMLLLAVYVAWIFGGGYVVFGHAVRLPKPLFAALVAVWLAGAVIAAITMVAFMPTDAESAIS